MAPRSALRSRPRVAVSSAQAKRILKHTEIVKSLEFSAEKKRLDIRLDFPKGSQFPCPECGRLCGAYDAEERTWRILNHYVEEARSRMDLSEVSQAGIDETSRAKGHEYVTVFMDLDKRRIAFATEGKDVETVKAFTADLKAHGGDPKKVKEFCLDMSPARPKRGNPY